ncbi:MAG: hypothetical protein U5K69_28995 [Balneolaceae bacterium]|nr:hypothetical protein [Balneolaceae bacterium]
MSPLFDNMSLLNQHKHFSAWDYLFVAIGLLGLFAYFMTYDTQDPRSMIDAKMDQSAVSLRAAEVANSLGFTASNYRTEVNFGTNRRLLDSLQYHQGRQQAIAYMQERSTRNLYPYYWEVHFEQKSVAQDQREVSFGRDQENVETGENEFILRFSTSGKWIELINGSDLLPERRINRKHCTTLLHPTVLWSRGTR